MCTYSASIVCIFQLDSLACIIALSLKTPHKQCIANILTFAVSFLRLHCSLLRPLNCSSWQRSFLPPLLSFPSACSLWQRFFFLPPRCYPSACSLRLPTAELYQGKCDDVLSPSQDLSEASAPEGGTIMYDCILQRWRYPCCSQDLFSASCMAYILFYLYPQLSGNMVGKSSCPLSLFFIDT